MKMKHLRKSETPATVVALALLLATGFAGTTSAGPPPYEADCGEFVEGCRASIGVSNVCTLEKYVIDNQDGTFTNKADLVVETTIIDKTLDKAKGGSAPVFGDASVQAQQKDGGRGGRERWSNLGAVVALNNGLNDPDTSEIETNTTTIDLCAAGNIDEKTQAINAVTMVTVRNATKGESIFMSQCDGGIKESGIDLKSDCGL